MLFYGIPCCRTSHSLEHTNVPHEGSRRGIGSSTTKNPFDHIVLFFKKHLQGLGFSGTRFGNHSCTAALLLKRMHTFQASWVQKCIMWVFPWNKERGGEVFSKCRIWVFCSAFAMLKQDTKNYTGAQKPHLCT